MESNEIQNFSTFHITYPEFELGKHIYFCLHHLRHVWSHWLVILSPKIHMSRYWSLDLPVPRWHRGLSEPTPWVGRFSWNPCRSKVSFIPSDRLFWALKPLFCCIIFRFFLVFSQNNERSAVSENANMKRHYKYVNLIDLPTNITVHRLQNKA
jgi:hypothetical protein